MRNFVGMEELKIKRLPDSPTNGRWMDEPVLKEIATRMRTFHEKLWIQEDGEISERRLDYYVENSMCKFVERYNARFTGETFRKTYEMLAKEEKTVIRRLRQCLTLIGIDFLPMWYQCAWFYDYAMTMKIAYTRDVDVKEELKKFAAPLDPKNFELYCEFTGIDSDFEIVLKKKGRVFYSSNVHEVVDAIVGCVAEHGQEYAEPYADKSWRRKSPSFTESRDFFHDAFIGWLKPKITLDVSEQMDETPESLTLIVMYVIGILGENAEENEEMYEKYVRDPGKRKKAYLKFLAGKKNGVRKKINNSFYGHWNL